MLWKDSKGLFTGNKENVQVVRAPNIEVSLTLLNALEDLERRKDLQYRMQKLDLLEESARMEADYVYRKAIREALRGSKYESRVAEIVDLVHTKKIRSRKNLYTGSLHLFGREDGTAIYRMVKNIEKEIVG